MRFYFNPHILKNYSLNQLSRAGGNEDVGSTSSQTNAAPLTRSGIFSNLLSNVESDLLDISHQYTDTSTNQLETTITDLDDLPNHENQHLSPTLEVELDEDSQSSPINVEWENRPETSSPYPDDHRPSTSNYQVESETNQSEHEEFSDCPDADPDYQPDSYCSIEQLDCASDEFNNPDDQLANHREQTINDESRSLPAEGSEVEPLEAGVPRRAVAVKHKLRSPCNCKRLQCYKKFSQEDRQEIWKEFWSMDFPSQRLFLAAHMNAKEITQRRPRREDHETRKRAASYSYHFWTSTEVCKEMFLSTLGFRSDKVLTLCRSTTTIFDQRGRSKNSDSHRGTNRRPLTKSQLDAVKVHIKSYEPGISHYRRKHAPKRLYLDPSLTVRDMYEDYKKVHPTDPVSPSTYYRELKAMNISFAKLCHEECEQCITIKHSLHLKEGDCTVGTDESCEECSSQDAHKKRYTAARELYQQDVSEKLPSDTLYFAADLQKVKMIPEIAGVKTALFTQRYAAYNETFSQLGSGKSFGVLWHQALMGRNDEDVTSAFMRTIFTTLACFMGERSEDTPVTITLKYFEAGHTFMAADSFHAQVEKQFRKKKNIYDFSDYLQCAVREAGNAVELTTSDFIDWKSGLSQGKTSQESRPLLEEVKMVQFRVGEDGFYFKRSYEAKDFEYAEFLTRKFKSLVRDRMFMSSQKTKSKPAIDPARKQGILDKLCPLMPADRKEFWRSL